MIRYMRSARVPQGQWLAALGWAQEVTGYLNSNFNELNVKVFTNRFGQINVMSWMTDAESLDRLDQYQHKVGDDRGYLERIGKSEGLFVTDSIVDTVFELL